MKSKLIVMLTHHDKTVSNALEIFEELKDLEVECWGFKDVGLPKPKMIELTNAMKQAGKKTFLEIVSYSEEECMNGARLAVQCGFDYLMGTIFFPSVWDYLKNEPIKYMPFVGEVSGSPSVLAGTAEEMISQSKQLIKEGVFGFDLLAYRHRDDGEKLAYAYCAALDVPIVVAGSISTAERITIMSRINPWGFTIGTALFDHTFKQDGGIRANLEMVCEIMKKLP